jgi:hypothetical protein
LSNIDPSYFNQIGLDDLGRYVGERGHYDEIIDRQKGLANRLSVLQKCSKKFIKDHTKEIERIKENVDRKIGRPTYRMPLVIQAQRPVGLATRVGSALAAPLLIFVNPCLISPSLCGRGQNDNTIY